MNQKTKFTINIVCYGGVVVSPIRTRLLSRGIGSVQLSGHISGRNYEDHRDQFVKGETRVRRVHILSTDIILPKVPEGPLYKDEVGPLDYWGPCPSSFMKHPRTCLEKGSPTRGGRDKDSHRGTKNKRRNVRRYVYQVPRWSGRGLTVQYC